MTDKKTKIICTIGPSSWDPKTLRQLAENGMNVARLNMSHGSHEEKADQIKLIRQISEDLGKPIAIIADLQGPKMRLGEMEGTKDIRKGDKISLSLSPIEDELPIQFDISPFVKKNQRIFLNDGLVEVKVTGIRGKIVDVVAQNNGWVSSHKGVNIPDTNLRNASFTPKDQEDLFFALKEGVEYINLSFVQTVKDLEKPRELIKRHTGGNKPKVIVKIEKSEAIVNLEEIIKAADAIMVARGDLAIETDAAEVPVMQQKMIRLCRQYQKPVIVATQMLESMTENPRPTRAETSDVANAVLDQVDGVMLSAESASGKYPVEAVRIMNEVIDSVEAHPDYKNYIKINWEHLASSDLAFNAIVSSAASIAYRVRAKLIVVATATGKTAQLLSSFRPDSQIIAITHNKQTSNQLSLVWGVRSIVVQALKNEDTFWKKAIEELKREEFAQKGDQIVLVSGTTMGLAGGTNEIQIVTV